MRPIAIIFLVLLVSGGLIVPVYGTELVEIERTAHNENASSAEEAKRIITNDIIETVSTEYIVEMIGEEKFHKNQGKIKSQIIQNSGRYIPFLKIKEFQSEGAKSTLTVLLKLSPQNLRAILLDLGMLYRSEGLPTVANFIKISDRPSSQVYEWWNGNGGEKVRLNELATAVEVTARQQFHRNGFYFLSPISLDLQQLLSINSQQKIWDEKDYQAAAAFLKADIVVGGEIGFLGKKEATGKPRMRINITAKFNANGRVLSETFREIEVDREFVNGTSLDQELTLQIQQVFDDLSSQLLKIWQKGVFGTSVYRVMLKGHLDFQQLQGFKKGLSQNSKKIMALRERLYEPGAVVFEADINGTSEEVTQLIGRMQFEGFQLKLLELQATGPVFKIISSNKKGSED